MTSQCLFVGKLALSSSINLNLITLGSRRTVWLLRMSRSSLRTPFSRRNRSVSRVRSKSSFETTSISRYSAVHLFNVDILIPRPEATCLRVRPLVSAIRSAPLRNSSVLVRAIVHLLYCRIYHQMGGTSRQESAAIYRVAIVRMRNHEPTLAYVRKCTKDVKSKSKIIRCLKRYIVGEIFTHFCRPETSKNPF